VFPNFRRGVGYSEFVDVQPRFVRQMVMAVWN
jgi:hypothetical protein